MTTLTAQKPLERYVDFGGAVEIFHEMGLTDITERMVRRYADQGKLPFFGGFTKKRWIEVTELRASVWKMQLEAVRGAARRR